MTNKEPTQLDLIEEIKRLNAKIDALTPKAPEPVVQETPEHEVWPKLFYLELRYNREHMYEFTEKWSMTKEAKLRLYTYDPGVVALEINRDGTYKELTDA